MRYFLFLALAVLLFAHLIINFIFSFIPRLF
jgi:hypothetical protein